MPKFSSAFFTRPGDVTDDSPIGHWGHLNRNDHTRTKTGLNKNPQALQVTTIAVPGTVENAVNYTVTESGVTATHPTTTTVQDDLGAGLVTQIGLNGTLRSRWVPFYDASANVLTLTGTHFSVAGTWTVSSGNANDLGAPSNVTAAATAAPVKFGRALVGVSVGTDTPNRSVFVADTTSFTAQVIDITITGAAGATFTPQLTFNGQPVTGDAVVWVTSDTVTALAILTEINALMDANFLGGASVLATQTAGLVTLTAEVPGATFDANIIAAGAASTATKVLTTGPSIATSYEKAFVGMSVRHEDVPNLTLTGDDPEYPANGAVEYAEFGTMYVQKDSGDTWALGDEAYVLLTAGTDAGRVYNALAAGCVWLPPSSLKPERGGTTTSDNTVGLISIQGA